MPKADHLSPGAVKLLQEPLLADFVTLMSDGSPQVTPVWVDVEPDGRHVLINTAEGRLKAKNTERDPRVALSIVDNQNPYRTVEVRGRVTERRHEGADAHIDAMAKKYLGQDKYPWRQPSEQRVILRIAPDRVLEQGTDGA
jgi:PPOX class probable F420-dependent enzyme